MSFGGPKHQRKVRECYPVKAGEEGPVLGKISVLIYYINSKPEKLLKVAAFLEKKVKKDILKERSGYNKVTLDIVDEIMSGCSDYFGSFVETALSIIYTLSHSSDYELLSHVVSTFVNFGRHARPIIPTIRNEDFFELLTKTANRLANLSLDEQISRSNGNLTELEMRAVNTLIEIEDFKTYLAKDRLVILISAFMRYFSKHEYETSPEGVFTMIRKDQLSEIQSESFLLLVRNLNSTSLDLFLKCIFHLCNTDDFKTREALRYSFLLIIKSLPSQFLCVFLTDLFRQLEKADEGLLLLLIDTVTDLILSNRGPLGYSALELASNLVRLLKKQRPPAPSNIRASFLSAGRPPPKSVFAICNALGINNHSHVALWSVVCILRNTNFSSQKYEIINHILVRAFISRELRRELEAVPISAANLPPDHVSLATITLDNAEEEQFRAVTWSVLFAMAEESLPASILKLAFVEIPSKLFESLFQLILNQNQEFRLNGLVLLYRLFLNGLSFSGHSIKKETNGKSLTLSTSPLPKAGQTLMAKFRNHLFATGRYENNETSHICILDGLLRIVLREADSYHLIQSILLVMTWQLDGCGKNDEKRALFMILCLSHIEKVAVLLECTELASSAQRQLESMLANKLNVFDLQEAFDEYPPPLCLKTSIDPKLEQYALPLYHVKELLLKAPNPKPSFVALVEEAFGNGRYVPEKDLASFFDGSIEEAVPSRKSFFPSKLSVPTFSNEDATGSVFGTRRSFASLSTNDTALTMPTYLGVPSAFQRANSVAGGEGSGLLSKSGNRPIFISSSAAASNSSLCESINSDSDNSVLDGDFANLTLRNKEKKKESREKDYNFLG